MRNWAEIFQFESAAVDRKPRTDDIKINVIIQGFHVLFMQANLSKIDSIAFVQQPDESTSIATPTPHNTKFAIESVNASSLSNSDEIGLLYLAHQKTGSTELVLSMPIEQWSIVLAFIKERFKQTPAKTITYATGTSSEDDPSIPLLVSAINQKTYGPYVQFGGAQQLAKPPFVVHSWTNLACQLGMSPPHLFCHLKQLITDDDRKHEIHVRGLCIRLLK